MRTAPAAGDRGTVNEPARADELFGWGSTR